MFISDYLAEHIRTHTKTRNYPCQFCQYDASTSDSLAVHINAVHLKRRYHCALCARSWVTAGNVRKHLRAAHGITSDYHTLMSLRDTPDSPRVESLVPVRAVPPPRVLGSSKKNPFASTAAARHARAPGAPPSNASASTSTSASASVAIAVSASGASARESRSSVADLAAANALVSLAAPLGKRKRAAQG